MVLFRHGSLNRININLVWLYSQNLQFPQSKYSEDQFLRDCEKPQNQIFLLVIFLKIHIIILL